MDSMTLTQKQLLDITEFICQFTMELTKRMNWHLHNGWGEKIRDSVRRKINSCVPQPDLSSRIHILKQVWGNRYV